jgi:hypothetical protein
VERSGGKERAEELTWSVECRQGRTRKDKKEQEGQECIEEGGCAVSLTLRFLKELLES